MKVLFAAYCMSDRGNSLIGVYKRCLRIAMELSQRGHEIAIFCPGREHYRDAVTAAAEQRFEFIEFPLRALFAPLDSKRRYYRRVFRRVRPDVVVSGEAPLAGTLLDSVLMAVEMRIPVVFLDNAYSPPLARLFAAVHGPMADGLVLTGPSSFHAPDAPEWFCQVPPYVDYSETAARDVLESIGLPDRLLITVLGYELKAERLASSLLSRLVDLDCHAVFITSDLEQCRLRLRTLPPAVRDRVRAIAPPPDPVLFGLLARARLAIGKCGFMQVSECLALRTPIVGVTYRGCFPLDLLSAAARSFVCAVAEPVVSDDVARTARQFLITDPERLAHLHDGRFGASERVADFLERLPREPRAGTTEECADQGYPRSILQSALEQEWPGEPIAVTRARCSRLRNLPGGRIDAIACEFTLGVRRKFAVLWGRRYASTEDAAADFADAAKADSRRTVLFASREDRLLIERHAGEQVLPALD